MMDGIIEDLKETEDALLEEVEDQARRANALDWAAIEKVLREKEGYDDEDIELEKQMFDTTVRLSNSLAGRSKKRKQEEIASKSAIPKNKTADKQEPETKAEKVSKNDPTLYYIGAALIASALLIDILVLGMCVNSGNCW